MKPKISLIGVGENNNFGHPSQEVLNHFKTLKTKIYRTDMNGEVTIEIDINGKIRKIKNNKDVK